MDHQPSSDLRARLMSWWKGRQPGLAHLPAKVWVVLGLFLVAAVLTAIHTAVSSLDSSLRLKVQHGFRSAQLSVWVDGSLAYSTPITGSPRKRFGLLPDSVQGSLSKVLPVSSGRHEVRVRLEPVDGSLLEDSISGEFSSHTERELAVSTHRGGLSLSWQGNAATVSSEDGVLSWFSRYASSLFLTIAGSIISALTGYAIRELPAHLRTRQTPEPKA